MPTALFATLALTSLSATVVVAAIVGSALHGPATVVLYHLQQQEAVLFQAQVWSSVGQAMSVQGSFVVAVLAILLFGAAALLVSRRRMRRAVELRRVLRLGHADRASRQARRPAA